MLLKENSRNLVVVFVGRSGTTAASHTTHRQCFAYSAAVDAPPNLSILSYLLDGGCPRP